MGPSTAGFCLAKLRLDFNDALRNPNLRGEICKIIVYGIVGNVDRVRSLCFSISIRLGNRVNHEFRDGSARLCSLPHQKTKGL